MRSCCAVYADAGYLLASVATRVSGSSLRSGIVVDHRKLVGGIGEFLSGHCGLPLLRTLWYDSAPSRGQITAEQEMIGVLPKVKLRLGRLSPSGEQKGVDLRLGLDLVAHARTGSIDVAYLISGDDDLSEAVEEAQAFGVQVVAVSVADIRGRAHGLAHHLRLTVDEVLLLPSELVDDTVTRRTGLPVTPTGSVLPQTTVAMTPTDATTSTPHRNPVDSVAVPSPKALADLVRDSTPPLFAPPPSPTDPSSVQVYSSETGRPTEGIPSAENGTGPHYAEEIDRVVQRVLQVWQQAASSEDVRRLWAGQPSIPSEIDRALLLDLSDEIQVYDVPEQVRFELRARFWSSAQEILAGR
ncbi:NYN domain-containing protein [Austwickia chelonae]|uniref:NYN domain-containing protein n=1 Tax=Austwickia chelonae TaxID=100225 RepID=UPI000E2256EF|nr:NYN domain-containing protein [Austwickia chelonae]